MVKCRGYVLDDMTMALNCGLDEAAKEGTVMFHGIVSTFS
jgi:hypothetical protein